ncbi:hypothetical protein CDCA_CDCA12G3364 [Cyanidium caldarium]|uniref:UDP-N-acetylglucosamine transferase subunit ALG13 n=1 Tax=Cyanidium caldarium TaxID=2771 RepID=A0AAV9IYI2_CYACA|nr:hypothetical protein CDCA_CDCA12G3364 [Cyanidium caldarium]
MSEESSVWRAPTVLVTVGTTRFESLIDALGTAAVLRELRYGWQCEALVVQYGTGRAPAFVAAAKALGMRVTAVAYVDDLRALQERADVIISHAGSGSIFEALHLHKPLVVVVNEALADNHQWELAEALAEQGHLLAARCADLLPTLRAVRDTHWVPLSPPVSGVLTEVLRSELWDVVADASVPPR